MTTSSDVSTRSRTSTGCGSSSRRPASSFDRSRMSLTTVSRSSPSARDRAEVLALLGVEAGVGQQPAHADDRVHRRADLVAHVGEELALRPRSGLGVRSSRVGSGEQLGALLCECADDEPHHSGHAHDVESQEGVRPAHGEAVGGRRVGLGSGSDEDDRGVRPEPPPRASEPVRQQGRDRRDQRPERHRARRRESTELPRQQSRRDQTRHELDVERERRHRAPVDGHGDDGDEGVAPWPDGGARHARDDVGNAPEDSGDRHGGDGEDVGAMRETGA